jgi:shikimate dehydrogenase/3-dehydroquinate dehydratase type I
MTGSSPRLVATLPARTATAAREEVRRAQVAGADLAEIRFDRWSSNERARAPSLFPSPLPLVATLRSRAEGGEGPDDPAERTTILSALADLPFRYVDVEARRDPDCAVPARAGDRPPSPSLIRSTHFPAGTPPAEVLAALHHPSPDGGLLKLVVPLSTGVAVSELLPALRAESLSADKVILTTGDSGPLLRALGKRLGLPIVFGSLPQVPGSAAPDSVEPSQVPVDRLHRFYEAAGEPPLFAVVGHPVQHSLSPWLHALWGERLARAGLYVPLEIRTAEEFRSVVPRLPRLGFRGVNVTHPWKDEALGLASHARPPARECGAANCLTFEGSETTADNTDVTAIRRRLEELRDAGRWGGEHLTVLGAGGAARATLVAARGLNARATVVARRRKEAEAVAARYGAEVGDPKHPMVSPLVIQATSAGHDPGEPLDLPLASWVAPGGYVLDWVYGGTDATVARESHRAGAQYEGGERVLVYQAAESFAAWWGEGPPRSALDEALRGVGCAV